MHNHINDILRIGGQSIPFKIRWLLQSDLKFYSENPRIYSAVCADDSEPSQDAIEKKLIQMECVNQLSQSISSCGGEMKPLMVIEGSNTVIKGNNRLAAQRLLARKNPRKWGNIRCYVLPKDINEYLILALLGECHIVKKRDWAAHDKARFLWQKHKKHHTEIEIMAKGLGIKKGEAEILIETYAFMIKHNDADVKHLRYYKEFLKSQQIGERRKECPAFDSVFAAKVKSGEIHKTVDVYEKVREIADADAGGEALKSFLEGKENLEDCYEMALGICGKNCFCKSVLKFFKRFKYVNLKKKARDVLARQTRKCLSKLKILDDLEKEELF